ncbi:olfactory receptor 1E16-like [Lissotriton helveticus]
MASMDYAGNMSTCCTRKLSESEFVARNAAVLSYVDLTGFCGEPAVTAFLHMFMLIMFLLSAALNLLVISVVVYKKVKNPMHLFIVNLAFADLLGSTVGILTVVPMWITKTSYISSEVCLVQVFLVYLFGGALGGIITTMAMDRYVAICNPLMYHTIFYRRKNVNILVFTWVVALTMAAIYVGLCVRLIGEPLVVRSYICDHFSIVNALMPTSTFDLIFNGLCTFLVCVVCFSWQYFTYKKIFEEIKNGNGSDLVHNSKLKLAKHLLIPVSTYVVGLLMYVSCVAEHFICHPVIINMKVISQVVYYTAVPTLNPVMYGLRTPELRTYIVHILRNWNVAICDLLNV